MPKIILEFGPGEEYNAEMSYRGPEFASAAECFRNYLRNKRKHADLTTDAQKLIEDVETAFHDYFDGLLKD